MKIRFSFFLISLFVLNITPVFAIENNEKYNSIDPAKIETLAKDREWLLLNHFWKNVFGLTVSRIDDPEFFISKQKNNPELELKSFLAAAIKESSLDANSLQCRFPARFAWIERKFDLIKNKIVERAECKEFQEWKDAINLKRVVLVFPSAYLNNPASMFGHTLLRLDSEQGIESPLLSYAAGFSAATGDDGGVAFAFKGLSGGYRSTYSVEPYYETVKRYGDIEHRDIWEYELLLTTAENEQVMASLWELGHSYFDYYFFDENCSYYLLALLETVRPSLNMIDEYGYWVIPSDTLKTVLSREEILGEIKFRPSLTSKLEAQSSHLSSENLELALKVATAEESASSIALERDGLSDLLEFSYDYLEYQNVGNESREELELDRNTAQEILLKRSQLPTTDLTEETILKPKSQPDLAHDSGKIFASLGRRGSQVFYDLELKPAYHDLLDRSDGFKTGAAINFFDIRVRHYESNRIQLQNFYPISIESYSPWSRLFKPFSWNVQSGLERELITQNSKSDVAGKLVGVLRTNFGVTIRPYDLFSLSVLPGIRAKVSPSYQDNDYALGTGVGFKVLGTVRDDLRYLIAGELTRFGIGEDHNNNNVKFELNYDINRQFILRTGIKRENSFSNYYTEYYLGIGSYF